MQHFQYTYKWINPLAPFTEAGDKKYHTSDGAWTIENDLIKLAPITAAGGPITQIGIYAPPGTQFLINNKLFIVGSSSSLELGGTQQDYIFTDLSIKMHKNYELLEEETKNYIANGVAEMDTALSQFLSGIKATIHGITDLSLLDDTNIIVNTDEYIVHQATDNVQSVLINTEAPSCLYTTFLENFERGYAKYVKGRQGIYAAYNNGQYIEPENIIVDIAY